MSDKITEINDRISQAEEIKLELSQLMPIPKRPSPAGVVSIDPTRHYDRSLVDAILQKINKWQFVTREILIKFFGEDNRYVRVFEESIVSVKYGRDYKAELLTEVGNGISALQSILESLSIVGEKEDPKEAAKESKEPLVFISHSSKDKDFVEALVDLLDGIGLDDTNLFCSSVPGFWIGLGKDIFEVLRSKFSDRKLYVIFVQSPRFYESPVSLNEMGAAWILRSDHCSVLTADMEYSKMTAVVNSHEIAIKVNADDAKARLTEMKNSIVDFLGISDITPVKWERIRDKFLTAVNPDYTSDVPPQSSVTEEYQRLMIQRMKEEQDEKKKALVKGNCYPGSQRGIRIVKIFNSGKSVAKNVRIEWLNEDQTVQFLKPFEIIEDITPQNSREFKAVLMNGCPDTLRLRYTWDDEYKTGNTQEESLQL